MFGGGALKCEGTIVVCEARRRYELRKHLACVVPEVSMASPNSLPEFPRKARGKLTLRLTDARIDYQSDDTQGDVNMTIREEDVIYRKGIWGIWGRHTQFGIGISKLSPEFQNASQTDANELSWDRNEGDGVYGS